MRSDIYRKSPTRKAETRNSNYKPSPAAKPGRKEGYSMQVTLNTRVPIDIAKALDDYAQASGKSKAAIVAAALQKYLNRHQLPEKESAMRFGLNGNHHGAFAAPPDGIEYLGDGAWNLPDGATVEPMGDEDWLIAMADGTKYRCWTED